MPAPPIPDRIARQAYDATQRAGTVMGGAKLRGVPEATHRKQYLVAIERLGLPDVRAHMLEQNLAEKAVAFTAPEIPPSHEPVDAMIARRKAAFQRKREAADAKRWMRFEIHEDAPFGLLFVGDPHADDDGCDLPTLERHLALMQRPGLFGVGMGDWTNNWVGRLQRLYAEQGTTASDAWRFAEWMLRRPGWLLLLRGNHDLWNGAGDPLRWIASGTAMVDWSAQFVVGCGEYEVKIEAAHDFPGSSMWNKNHALLKRAKLVGQEADIYVAGHRHTFALHEEQDEYTGRVSWLARVRGYKALDSYAHVSGFGQQQDRGQSVLAVCEPAARRIRCFSDAEEGADYLRFLRKPRVRVAAGRAP